MTITVVNKTSGNAATSTPYTTASWQAQNGRLYLLTAHARKTGGTPVQPTVAGNGLTWVLIADVTYSSSANVKRHSLFRGMVTPGAFAGTTVITYPADTLTNGAWVIDEMDGINNSGANGSGAIVQSVTGADNTNLATTLTISLAKALKSGSITYASFAEDTEPLTQTVGPGYTLVGQTHDGVSIGNATEVDRAGLISAAITWSGATNIGGILIEVSPRQDALINTLW